MRYADMTSQVETIAEVAALEDIGVVLETSKPFGTVDFQPCFSPELEAVLSGSTKHGQVPAKWAAKSALLVVGNCPTLAHNLFSSHACVKQSIP